MSIVDAALYYASDAAFAAPVFPISPWNKRPYKNPPGVARGRGGLHLATREPDRLRPWFEIDHQDAMLAMRTDGYLVVDFDIDPTCGCSHVLDEWAEPDDFPDTLQARTPRGGSHYFYRLPDGVVLGPTAGVIGSYIDTRSSRSYVVVPPSTRSDGKCYVWVNWGTPIAEAPERWVSFLRDRTRTRAHETGGPPVDFSTLLFPQEPTAYARKVLENVCAETAAAREGTRHDTLLRSAIRMGQLVAGEQIEPGTARFALRTAGRVCELPSEEIERAIDDGLRYGSCRPQHLVDPELKALADKWAASRHRTQA